MVAIPPAPEGGDKRLRTEGRTDGRGVMDRLLAGIEIWLADPGRLTYVMAPLVMVGVSALPMSAEAPALANGVIYLEYMEPL